MVDMLLALIFALTIQQPLVAVSYDKFKDITTVSTPSLNWTAVIDEGESPEEEARREWQRRFQYLQISAEFAYAGRRLVGPPDMIVLRFSAYSPHSIVSLSNSSFIALVDGQRLRLPRTRGVSGSHGQSTIPLATFRKLISGKRVELQIGNQESLLPDATLQALRELDAYTRK